jgi:hypothetical protein
LAPSDTVAKPTPVPVDDKAAVAAKSAADAKAAEAKSKTSAKADKQDSVANAPAPPPGPDPAEVAEVTEQLEQLGAREAALNSSLDNLVQQQSQQGLGLRGDMVEARASMKTYLDKAQASVQAQDVEKSRKYLKLAEAQIEKLEKFLGR